jgi:phosphoglycolate phosphatase-like HAD superfamily hydrolase
LVSEPTLSQIVLPPEIAALRLDPAAPLVVVDVDEVLAMFMHGFERFLVGHGLEMRLERFAIFQNIFRPGETEHLDVAAGRELFEAFFETDVEHIDPAPGAREALDALAARASIVILTNAPPQSRQPRARWLVKHGFDYPFIINAGPKGPAVAAMTALTTGKAAFVDDLLPNLDSVAQEAPAVATFQLVADQRLRPLAYAAPDRHPRIDDWDELGKAIAAAIGVAEP